MRILRKKVGWHGMQIRKITATTARYTNFFCQLTGMIDDQDTASTLTSCGSTHHASCPCADNNNICLLDIFILRHGQGMLMELF
jgi:hypothetical protein